MVEEKREKVRHERDEPILHQMGHISMPGSFDTAVNETNSSHEKPSYSAAGEYHLQPPIVNHTLPTSAASGSLMAPLSHGQQVNQSRADAKRSVLGKSLAEKKNPDVLARQLKKRISKSSEHKIRELVAYREDVVNTLRIMIPVRKPHDPTVAHPPLLLPVPHTLLCTSCATTLVYMLYYSPTSRSSYLLENATPAYCALIDDANLSLKANVPLEPLSHFDLDSTLRGELAVIEWRLSLKLARYHKKTGFLGVFPTRIGEYAELTLNKKLAKQPEGLFVRTGKKALEMVGLRSGEEGARQGPQAGLDEEE